MELKEKNIEELKEKATKILNESENKGEAITQVIDMFVTERNSDLINEITSQAVKSEHDKEYAKKIGLRTLSKAEEEFYEKMKNIKQAITGEQISYIPVSIVDLTMENVKTDEPVLKLINFAPADVKRWIIAEKTGLYSWKGLTEDLEGELTVNVSSLITNLGKLSTYLIIPKAISKLSYQFMDKYFMAILEDVLKSGLAYGYLSGTGLEQPIGIYKQIDKVNEDGTHKDKEIAKDVKDFSPKGLAPVKKYLTNEGKRVINKLYLICNPSDEAEYVAPAIYDRRGELVSSFKNLEVIQCTENPIGKAIFTLDKKYTMGMDGFEITKYDQTKALEDADLLIGKAYANGRAVADNVAYPFDVTKLEEFIEKIKVLNSEEKATEV